MPETQMIMINDFVRLTTSGISVITYLPALDIFHDFSLPLQCSLLTTIRVPIAFGQQQGNKVDAGPHFLSL